MTNYIKISLISSLLLTSIATAAPSTFCPNNATCTPVWSMKSPVKPSDPGGTHGKSWITCNQATNAPYDGPNGNLTINYVHAYSGDMEHTCYVKFDLFTTPLANQPAFQKHGYLTATITVYGDSTIADKIWPAFWLEGKGTWPVYGEIDTAEYMAATQGFTTHTNLHGGPSGNVDIQRSAVINYGHPGLGDINKTHVYGIEWELDPVTQGYFIKVYLDNVLMDKPVFLNKNVYPDAAIIKGLTNKDGNGMQVVFDADDIRSNQQTETFVKNLSPLSYKFVITDVNAFSVTP